MTVLDDRPRTEQSSGPIQDIVGCLTEPIFPASLVTDVTVSELTVREQAVQAWVRETGCTADQAEAMLVWLQGWVEKARENGGLTYVGDDQMALAEYKLFDELMPHGPSDAEPGSARQLTELALLDPTLGEEHIVHDRIDTTCCLALHMQVQRSDEQPMCGAQGRTRRRR